jgi:hypothetical protein
MGVLLGAFALVSSVGWYIWKCPVPSSEELRRELDELDERIRQLRAELDTPGEFKLWASILRRLTPPISTESFWHRERSKITRPPILGCYLLFLLLNANDRRTIIGDLEEEFVTVILPQFGV